MTVITENIENIAGVDDSTTFRFSSPVLRDSDGSLVTTAPTASLSAVGGVLTTPDLNPGPATVVIGVRAYNIEIPESSTPVRLWPLIETGLPAPPTLVGNYVVNGGGIARVQKLTESEYAALALPDPETEYSVVPDPD